MVGRIDRGVIGDGKRNVLPVDFHRGFRVGDAEGAVRPLDVVEPEESFGVGLRRDLRAAALPADPHPASGEGLGKPALAAVRKPNFLRPALVRAPGVEPGSMASEATTLSIVLRPREWRVIYSPRIRGVKPASCGRPARNENAGPAPGARPGARPAWLPGPADGAQTLAAGRVSRWTRK